MADVKFVDGLFVSKKEGSPDFVIANLSFNEKFIEYLKGNLNAKGYCNIDLQLSKEGKMYAKLNEWKPSENSEQGQSRENVDASKIPF